MHYRLIAFFALFVALIGDVTALSLDPAASLELEQCLKQGECVISMRHIRPRRKLHISIEALFMIDFPKLKHQMSFFLDRNKQRITLDIGSNGTTESRHFKMPDVNETTTIRSLALHMQDNRITLLVDCKKTAAHELNVSFSKLYAHMDTEAAVKLFRERKYPLHFDTNVVSALHRANCQRDLLLRDNEQRNKKREVRTSYGQNTNYETPVDVERGDIPIMHGDCEDAIAKSISDLLALIKLLREDVANQRQEIGYLRRLLENCAGCKAPSSLVIESNCRNANPCYPGVDCLDSPLGPRCGRCPDGMIGDGKMCKHSLTCNHRPCFEGVQCRDTLGGPQCDRCPLGYDGDGRICTKRDSCLNAPCSSGNFLMPSHNIQHYQRQYTARKYSILTS